MTWKLNVKFSHGNKRKSNTRAVKEQEKLFNRQTAGKDAGSIGQINKK